MLTLLAWTANIQLYNRLLGGHRTAELTVESCDRGEGVLPVVKDKQTHQDPMSRLGHLKAK